MLVIGIVLILIGLLAGYALPHYGPAYGNWGYGPGAILVVIGIILVVLALLGVVL